jgi:hypothetical protein
MKPIIITMPNGSKHEVEVREGAEDFFYHVGLSSFVHRIPIPQPEKRCRWRTTHPCPIVTEGEWTRSELGQMVLNIDRWEPVE